jgi:hypothetical protein
MTKMNASNPGYAPLLREAVERASLAAGECYEPYLDDSSADDVAHWWLHLHCSFLVQFLMKMRQVAHKPDGQPLTLDEILDEFTRIMKKVVKDQQIVGNEDLH